MTRRVPVPRAGHHRISAPASYAGLKDLFDGFHAFADQHELPDAIRHDVYLAIEELVSNVIRHGRRPGARPRVTIALRLASDALHVTVADDAEAFDPLDVQPPDVTTSVLERDVGGLGIHLVRALMHDVRYRRQAGRNHVRLTRKLG